MPRVGSDGINVGRESSLPLEVLTLSAHLSRVLHLWEQVALPLIDYSGSDGSNRVPGR
jgi:hypothetical protein